MQKVFKFPENFLWGAATASYQIEGGIDNNDWAQGARDGKVPPAGDSTDHYNRYKEDFDLAKELGQNSQRISIEWSRIEPEEGKFDKKEIEHYVNVLLEIKKRGLTPIVTLWHFTLPLWFSERGGFGRSDSDEIFTRYCVYVVSHLHEHCDIWDTINEPMVWSSNGYYRGNWPPFKKDTVKFLRVIKRLAKAHNSAYREIKRMWPQLSVGIVKDNIYFSSDKKIWNIIASRFMDWFWNHRFFNKIKNNFDHIGLNYYFYHRFASKKQEFKKSDMGWDLNPEGLYHCLIALKRYHKPLFVAEVGLADEEDKDRAWYIEKLIYWTSRAMQGGADVRGFMYWSLLDNFEWAFGYEKKFGLISVDETTKKRTIRKSANVYKNICETNVLTIR